MAGRSIATTGTASLTGQFCAFHVVIFYVSVVLVADLSCMPYAKNALVQIYARTGRIKAGSIFYQRWMMSKYASMVHLNLTHTEILEEALSWRLGALGSRVHMLDIGTLIIWLKSRASCRPLAGVGPPTCPDFESLVHRHRWVVPGPHALRGQVDQQGWD